MAWLTILLLMAPIVVFMAIGRNQAKRVMLRSRTVALTVDEFGARRELADGRREEVDWGEVTEVEVVTAKKGPHGAAGGVVVLTGDAERGCLIPLDQLAQVHLLEQLQRLPGFEVDRFVAALEAPPPSRTSCWGADHRSPN